MIEQYIERYAKSRGISKEEAVTHEIVKEAAKYYRERGKDAGRNERVADITDCKGC